MHDSAELVVIASPSGVGRPARSPDTSPALPLSGAMLHLVGTPARPQGCRSPYPRAFASVDPGSGGSTGRATKALFRSRLSATPTTRATNFRTSSVRRQGACRAPNARQLPANLGCELVHVDGHALPHPIRRLHLREGGLARAKVCFALEQGKGRHAHAISIDEHRQPTAAPGSRAAGPGRRWLAVARRRPGCRRRFRPRTSPLVRALPATALVGAKSDSGADPTALASLIVGGALSSSSGSIVWRIS